MRGWFTKGSVPVQRRAADPLAVGAAVAACRAKRNAVRRLLFVYGTLMVGEENHHVLDGAPRLGAARTRRGYDLVDQGAWPGLVAGGSQSVWGELVAVVPTALAALDAFEDCPEVYQRRRITLACGTSAEAYLLQPRYARQARRLRPACWPAHARTLPRRG